MNTSDWLTIDVDPDTNDGFDQAPALVLGVYSDGSARVRVFGARPELDTTRNYVGADGKPYDATAAQAGEAPTDVEPIDNPDDTPPPAAPTEPAQPGVIPPA